MEKLKEMYHEIALRGVGVSTTETRRVCGWY